MAARKTSAKRTGKGGQAVKEAAFPPVVHDRSSASFGDHVIGHPYLLWFAEVPGAEERAAIARAFEQASEGTLVETPPSSHPWLWSGAQALVRLFESPDTPGQDEPGFTRYLQQVEKVLRAVHAAWPLVKVGQPAGAPSLPSAEPDPAFEAARVAAQEEIRRARADKQLRQAKGKAGVALSPIEERDLPSRPDVPAWVMATCDALAPPRPRQPPGQRCQVEPLPAGGYVALLAPDATRDLLVVLEAEEQPPRQVELPRIHGRRVLRLRPDGGAVLYADQQSLFEVGLPQGTPRIVGSVEHAPGDDEWVEAVYLPDGRIAASTTRGLHLLRREHGQFRRVDFIPVPGGYHELAITEDGRFLVVTAATGPARATVFGVRGAELRALGTIKQEARAPIAHGGRLFVESKGKPAEIVNLEPAFAAAYAAPPGEAPGPAAEKLGTREIALVPADAPPPDATIPPEVMARFEDALRAQIVPGAGGSYLAVVDRMKAGKCAVAVAVLSSAGDAPRWLDLPAGGYRLLACSQGGERALLSAIPPNNVLEIELPAGEVRWLIRREAYGGAYAPGDRIALLSASFGLELFARRGDALEKIADLAIPEAAELASARGGELLAARTPDGDVTLVAVSDSGLEPIARLSQKAARVEARGDRLLAVIRGAVFLIRTS